MESKNIATLRAAHEAFSAHDCARSALIGVEPHVKFIDHGRGISVSSREEFQSWLEGHVATSSAMVSSVPQASSQIPCKQPSCASAPGTLATMRP